MLVAVLKLTMVECSHSGDKLVSMETKPEMVHIQWQLIDDSHPKSISSTNVHLFINPTAQIILQLKPQQLQRQH